MQLIGKRISEGQTLTDNRVGLGDQILVATTGTAAAAGNAAGLILAAPVAVVDQNTSDNYANQVGALGAPKSGAKKLLAKACEDETSPTKRCN